MHRICAVNFNPLASRWGMFLEILKNKHFSVVCLIRFQLRQEVHKGSADWWHCTAVVVKKCSCGLMIERETIMSSCLLPLLIFRIQVFHHRVIVLQ